MELWTERQATRHLMVPGVGRDAARSALKANVAGRPLSAGGTLLYDARAVCAVLDRMDPPCEIRQRTGRPIFVARVAPRTPDPASSWRTWRGADVLAPRPQQLDAVRGWWHLGFRLEALLRGVGQYKGVPFVATCGGIVVLGAEIRGIDAALADEGAALSEARIASSPPGSDYTRRAYAFVLDEPGAWFDGQRGRRFTTGAGGPFRLLHGRKRDASTGRPRMEA
ncbi:hypothetical protein [Nocardioides renjunii]|uniref:hypothetical protein n=1 Tax=Nocardioides renjunii TaxID=3095075 RepID=UPI002AFF713E|nr:hypothetical protein [Nocardioides sp. S-34]WQQ23020.1 hypothetical protein SHK17_03385 [Nocardioides sp. S-34]